MLIYSTYWVFESDQQRADVYLGLGVCEHCHCSAQVNLNHCEYCGKMRKKSSGRWHGGEMGYSLEEALQRAFSLSVKEVHFKENVGFKTDLNETKFKVQHPQLFPGSGVVLRLPDVDFQPLIAEFVDMDANQKADVYRSAAIVFAKYEKFILWHEQIVETQEISPIRFGMTPEEVMEELGEPDEVSTVTENDPSLVLNYDGIAFHFDQKENQLYRIYSAEDPQLNILP